MWLFFHRNRSLPLLRAEEESLQKGETENSWVQTGIAELTLPKEIFFAKSTQQGVRLYSRAGPAKPNYMSRKRKSGPAAILAAWENFK